MIYGNLIFKQSFLTCIRIIATETGVVNETLYAECGIVEVVRANVDDVRPMLKSFAEERVCYSKQNRRSGKGRNEFVRMERIITEK